MNIRWSKSFCCLVLGIFLVSCAGGLYVGTCFFEGGSVPSKESVRDMPSQMDLSAFDIHDVANADKLVGVAIIGSGPAGDSAALYAVRGGFNTVIFEGNTPGGLLMQTSEVENWPGERLIAGAALMEKIKGQAAAMGAIFVREAIAHIDVNRWPYRITTEGDETFDCMTIILALGSSPSFLKVPGEQEYWGSGVTACAVCDGNFFKGKKVVVVGGGDAAVGEAVVLAHLASQVTILVRSSHMRAAATVRKHLEGYPNVSIRYNVAVTEIKGDGKQVTGVTLVSTDKSGDTSGTTEGVEFLPVDGVFLAIGHIPNTGFVKDIIDCDEHGYIKVGKYSQETSVRGIFAAGDVQDYIYRQAIVAAGDGVKASLDAQRFLSSLGYNTQFIDTYKNKFYVPHGATDLQGDQEISFVSEISSQADLCALAQAMPDTLMILDFGTPECVLCKQIEPFVKKLAHDYGDRVHVAMVNGNDADPELLAAWAVTRYPTLVFVSHGKFQARLKGEITEAMVRTTLERILGSDEKEDEKD